VKSAGGYRLRVALFCGGRGAAALVREFLRWPHVDLSLLINAYDDGLSTGALRDFIPGMLGPSDFRKNLSYLVDPYSPAQYSLQRLLEYRLPRDFASDGTAALARFAATGDASLLPAEFRTVTGRLEPHAREEIRGLLGGFVDFARSRPAPLDFGDVSVGNLIFAGSYLRNHERFNAAIDDLARLFRSKARLVNISSGECRSLVALKADGELLASESAIVAPQSETPILDLFFLERPPGRDAWRAVETGSIEEKSAWLRSREIEVAISAEAQRTLREADVIVYGAGTQHSSLLPSYRIAGAAVRESRAATRAFIVNLQHDVDIAGLDACDLVDRALTYLGDPQNDGRAITHVLYDERGPGDRDAVRLDRGRLESGRYRGALVVEGAFANPSDPAAHSGSAVARQIFEIADRRLESGERAEIYVDLFRRSPALEALLQEFAEIDWHARFAAVRLRVNATSLPPVRTHSDYVVEAVRSESPFPEVKALADWLERGEGEYLATITGDGEYRLRDVLLGVRVLEATNFGAVYGSRTQSRRQFQASLGSAYGEGGVLYRISWLGAFVLTALFGLRFNVIFSDPLTGFRIYRRSRLTGPFAAELRRGRVATAASVTRLLIRCGVEISEIPVTYRTFAGFTNPAWRLQRGLRNVLGVFGR
jgi:2-phospho-L-lactate transferase/gluconeogenesis factor (CofD/UPF0052 family)